MSRNSATVRVSQPANQPAAADVTPTDDALKEQGHPVQLEIPGIQANIVWGGNVAQQRSQAAADGDTAPPLTTDASRSDATSADEPDSAGAGKRRMARS